MNNKSAIEEYCKACQQKHANESRQQSQADRQEAMLEELLQRSRSDFGRSFFANLAADATFDILKYGLKGLTKIF